MLVLDCFNRLLIPVMLLYTMAYISDRYSICVVWVMVHVHVVHAGNSVYKEDTVFVVVYCLLGYIVNGCINWLFMYKH